MPAREGSYYLYRYAATSVFCRVALNGNNTTVFDKCLFIIYFLDRKETKDYQEVGKLYQLNTVNKVVAGICEML